MKFLFPLLLFAATAAVAEQPDHTAGTAVYVERCMICHGRAGMGEGYLPLALDDYPETSLANPRIASDLSAIEQVVRKGGLDEVSAYSPPWEHELSPGEISAVSKFVAYLREAPESAATMIESRVEEHEQRPNQAGRLIYQSRCALCHGESGLGDGRMAAIVKSPPPFNLTLSVMPDAYLKEIITRGGEAMGRSVQMPPWVDELSPTEIELVIAYIKTLRQLAARR